MEPSDPHRLEQLGSTDPPTGLATSEALRLYMEPMMAMAHRTRQQLAVFAVNLSACGDGPLLEAAMRGAAAELRRRLREYDLLARHDRETLAAVLLATDEATAARVAERILPAVEKCLPKGVTAAGGVAGLSLDTPSPRDLLAHACQAARRAAQLGAGTVWRHSQTVALLAAAQAGRPGDAP